MLNKNLLNKNTKYLICKNFNFIFHTDQFLSGHPSAGVVKTKGIVNSETFCEAKSNPSNSYRVAGSSLGAVLGLGLWRLRPLIRPKIATLAARIEKTILQCCFEDGLAATAAGEFEYWDTSDPSGEKDSMDPFFATNAFYPSKGEIGYPRFQLENRLYTSRVFRKIHIELAVRQDGLQVLHVVFFPSLNFDLPILCMDVVAKDEDISLAIVDTSPVRWDNSLPDFYSDSVDLLKNQAKLNDSNRNLPDWFRMISSRLCIGIKPSSELEFNQFINYTCSLTRFHLEVARSIAPIKQDDINQVNEIYACQRRFCDSQIKNEKTCKILLAAFGRDKADKYMRGFMFDIDSKISSPHT